MKIKLKKFLCFELEIGGIVIGCFGVTLNSILSAAVAYCIYIMYEKRSIEGPIMKKIKENYDLVMFSLFLIMMIFSLISSYKCVKATKTRDPDPFSYTTFWLVVYMDCSIGYLTNSAHNGDKSGLVGLIGVIVFGYFACVTHSIHQKFSNKDPEPNVGYGHFNEPI